MQQAMLYDSIGNERVQCRLCVHRCVLAPAERGLCGVRENRNGHLVSLVYGRLVARDIDPVEKKPLFHVLPGTRAYSIATVGCNLTCRNCQNHHISQYPREHGGRIIGEWVPVHEVIDDAVRCGCRSIAYTYTEPTVAWEYVFDVMKAARREGLANLWVTNGYFTAEAAALLAPVLDAANIDLKGVHEETVYALTGGHVRPVLQSVERLVRAGIWVEVTTLVIPGVNDRPDELRRTAEAIGGISKEIPWHVSRFFPAYRMSDRPPTPWETMESARQAGRDAGLSFVYLGNLPGVGEDTHCPGCGFRVIQRSGYAVRSIELTEGHCPRCQAKLPGLWDLPTRKV